MPVILYGVKGVITSSMLVSRKLLFRPEVSDGG